MNKIALMEKMNILPEVDFLLWNRVNSYITVKFFDKIKGNESNIKSFNFTDKKKTIEKDWLKKYVLINNK